MPWFTGAQLMWGVVAMAASGVIAYTAYDHRRGRLRNAAGNCARCGAPWAARYPQVDRALLAGNEVCTPCADTLRTRATRGLVGILVAGAVVGAATILSNGADMARGNLEFEWRALLYWIPPTAALTGVATFALWRMKRWNRAALSGSAATTTLPGSIAPRVRQQLEHPTRNS